MRFEKTYDGVKTVLEGQELQKMLTQFSGYNLDEGLYKPAPAARPHAEQWGLVVPN